MKNIDTHMHYYDGGFPPGEYESVKIDELLRIMDRYEIEKAWISSLTSMVGDPIEGNMKLYKFCSQAPGKFVPFYSFNPNQSLSKMKDEIHRCYEVYGGRGMKIHSWLSGFSVSSSAMYELSGLCAEFNMPILFHDGTSPYCDPLQIASLGELHPDLKLIMGHSGICDMHYNAISAAENNTNIYLCFCCTVPGDIETIVQRIPVERLLFGTDFYGIEKFSSYIDNMLDAVKTADISDKVRQMILYDNASNLIKQQNILLNSK